MWGWKVEKGLAELVSLQRDTIARLRAENDRLSHELEAARRDQRAVVVPPDESLPPAVEAAIRAKFGWSPMGAAMTRSVASNLLRVTHDPDAVVRALDTHGEVVD